MSTYIIYKTTNLINGKIYVGQHCKSEDDGYFGSGKVIKHAIKKYGKENFVRETLEFCTPDNVDEREVHWIDKLDARNPEFGYNIQNGGFGRGRLSNQEKQHLSIIMMGNKNPNYGNKWTEEQKDKLRQLNLGKKLSKEHKNKISIWNKENGNQFKGKTHSKELREKWSQERKGTRLGEENSFYGKTHSKKSKKLIGASSKLRTKYVYFFESPSGEIFSNILNLQDFCNKFGWRQNNLKFVNNNWTSYKGWKIKRVYKENIENE